MNGFEYALGLFSVLIGLALVDIAMSVHKLVRHCTTVRWDFRVILSALLVVFVVVRMWFSLWMIRNVGIVLSFPFFLSLFFEFTILFLLASNCLPDKPPADCDLSSFYDHNRRSLWTLFAIFQLSFFAHWIAFGGAAGPLLGFAVVLVPLVAYAALAIIRARAAHLVIPALLIVFELYNSWSWSLT